jgi:hypothetical protein
MNEPKGIFASEYSAMTQSAVMATPFGQAEYLGQLRLDVVFAGTIVVLIASYSTDDSSCK